MFSGTFLCELALFTHTCALLKCVFFLPHECVCNDVVWSAWFVVIIVQIHVISGLMVESAL